MGRFAGTCALIGVYVLFIIAIIRQNALTSRPQSCVLAAAALADIPDAREFAKAKIGVQQTIGESAFKDQTEEGRGDLATKLLTQGRQTRENLAYQYYCFTEARDLAAGVGDVDTAFAAIDELNQTFNKIDARKMQVTALLAAAPHLKTAPSNLAIVEPGLTLLRQTIDADDLDTANRLASVLHLAATRSGELPLRAKVEAAQADLRKAPDVIKRRNAAIAVLRTQPNDPTSNDLVGRWECFTKGEWDSGLAKLEKSNDHILSALAKKERTTPVSDPLAKVADDWWDYAGKLPEAAVSSAIQKHAQNLYRKAIPVLAGDNLLRAQERTTERASSKSSLPPIDTGINLGTQKTLDGHTERIWHVEFLPGGRLLSASIDHSVRIWDLASGKEIKHFDDGSRTPCWDRNYRFLLAGKSVWDLNSGKSLPLPNGPQNGLGFSPDGMRFVARADDGKITEYQTQTCQPIRVIGTGSANGGYSADGRYLLLESGGSFHVYNVAGTRGGKEVAILDIAKHKMGGGLAGTMLASGNRALIWNNDGKNGSALIWNFENGQTTELFTNKSYPANVAVSPNGRYVYICTWTDGTNIYDVETGAVVARPPALSSAAAFFPDGSHVLFVRGSHFSVIDLSSGKEIYDQNVDDGEASEPPAVSRDARFVAVVSKHIHVFRLPDLALAGKPPASEPSAPPKPASGT